MVLFFFKLKKKRKETFNHAPTVRAALLSTACVADCGTLPGDDLRKALELAVRAMLIPGVHERGPEALEVVCKRMADSCEVLPSSTCSDVIGVIGNVLLHNLKDWKVVEVLVNVVVLLMGLNGYACILRDERFKSEPDLVELVLYNIGKMPCFDSVHGDIIHSVIDLARHEKNKIRELVLFALKRLVCCSEDEEVYPRQSWQLVGPWNQRMA